jgi:lysophospholipase L1-like esterase
MMLYLNFLLLFFSTPSGKSLPMQQTKLHYLALGDSYTIGEGVPLFESFPYQAVQKLRKKDIPFAAPEIVAKTGWTSDELQAGIRNTRLLPKYDLVSLLIGVNNQYRGQSTDVYAAEFESLLKQAIVFAGNDKNRVVVLSIPDWGATPFAEGRDRAKITTEIDAFNAINRKIAGQYKVQYIDITPGTRMAAQDPSLVTKDKLHPSGKEYTKWAEELAKFVMTIK